jgi:hypothetical protein
VLADLCCGTAGRLSIHPRDHAVSMTTTATPGAVCFSLHVLFCTKCNVCQLVRTVSPGCACTCQLWILRDEQHWGARPVLDHVAHILQRRLKAVAATGTQQHQTCRKEVQQVRRKSVQPAGDNCAGAAVAAAWKRNCCSSCCTAYKCACKADCGCTRIHVCKRECKCRLYCIAAVPASVSTTFLATFASTAWREFIGRSVNSRM